MASSVLVWSVESGEKAVGKILEKLFLNTRTGSYMIGKKLYNSISIDDKLEIRNL